MKRPPEDARDLDPVRSSEPMLRLLWGVALAEAGWRVGAGSCSEKTRFDGLIFSNESAQGLPLLVTALLGSSKF